MHIKHVAATLIITGLFFMNFNTISLVRQPALNYSCVCSLKHPTPNNGSLIGFYNMFEGDTEPFQRITQEQIDFIDASNLPFKSISYTYFGAHAATYRVPSQKPYWTRSERSNATGNEGVTLQALYEHCLNHQDDQVMYFHSKGSYHTHHRNDLLRQNLMKALVACFDTSALLTHDMCGLRISPAPHPQYSGNMWHASCRYIAKLLPPETFEAAMNDIPTPSCPDWAVAQNRFAYEHWAVSHPSLTASDVLPSDQPYVWAYNNLPDPASWTPQLSTFPRPELASSFYFENTDVMHCSFKSHRVRQYELLYGKQAELPCSSMACHHMTVRMLFQLA